MSEKNSLLRGPLFPIDRVPIHDGNVVHIPLMADGYETRGKNLLALYARTALMDLLLTNEQVQELWEQWGERSGLLRAARAVVETIEDIGSALGEERQNVLENGGLFLKGDEIAQSLVVTNKKFLWDSYCKALVEFEKRYNPKHEWMDADAQRFVREELRLNFEWLPESLLAFFDFYSFYVALYGLEVRVRTFPRHPAPDCVIQFDFRPLRGETEEQALERLRDQYQKERDGLKAAYRKASGRTPTQGGKKIQQYTNWYYRYKVLGERIRALARERHAHMHPHTEFTDDDGCRRSVRYGICQAEKVLKTHLEMGFAVERG